VLVVLDAPGLKGIGQRHEGKGADNILQQLVLAEAAVTTVVAHHEELQTTQHRGEGRSALPSQEYATLLCAPRLPRKRSACPPLLMCSLWANVLLHSSHPLDLFLSCAQLCLTLLRFVNTSFKSLPIAPPNPNTHAIPPVGWVDASFHSRYSPR